jgi:hypothetical protein
MHIPITALLSCQRNTLTLPLLGFEESSTLIHRFAFFFSNKSLGIPIAFLRVVPMTPTGNSFKAFNKGTFVNKLSR